MKRMIGLILTAVAMTVALPASSIHAQGAARDTVTRIPCHAPCLYAQRGQGIFTGSTFFYMPRDLTFYGPRRFAVRFRYFCHNGGHYFSLSALNADEQGPTGTGDTGTIAESRTLSHWSGVAFVDYPRPIRWALWVWAGEDCTWTIHAIRGQ